MRHIDVDVAFFSSWVFETTVRPSSQSLIGSMANSRRRDVVQRTRTGSRFLFGRVGGGEKIVFAWL